MAEYLSEVRASASKTAAAPAKVFESTAHLENGLASSSSDDAELQKGTGVPGTTANLVSSIIGTGVLALPSCVAKAGWGLSIILVVVSGALTWLGLYLLTECARKIGGRNTSWGVVAASTFPWLTVVVDICAGAVAWGFAVAFMTIASGSIPHCVEQFAPNLPSDSVLLQPWYVHPLSYVVYTLTLGAMHNVIPSALLCRYLHASRYTVHLFLIDSTDLLVASRSVFLSWTYLRAQT